MQPLAGVSGDIPTVAGVSNNVTTVAGISNNVTTVAGINTAVTNVANNNTDISTVAGQIAPTNNISTVASRDTDIGTVASRDTDIGTVAARDTDIGTVAGIHTQVTAVANDATDIGIVAGEISPTNNISTVAGRATEIGLLGVADVITDMGLLGTAAVVEDMGFLGTQANVTAMGNLGTQANVTAMSNINSALSDVTTVATDLGGNNNIGTVANNIGSVNGFAEKYRIGSSDPSSNNDEGDLFYNTTSDALKIYNGSAWTDATTTVAGVITTSNLTDITNLGTLSGDIVFEGSTADTNETTVTVTDPTADRTITLPDATGTVITTGNLSSITNLGTLSGDIVFEGSSADDHETTVTVTNPTADRTITLPNASGTVITSGNGNDLTSATNLAAVGSTVGIGGSTTSFPRFVKGNGANLFMRAGSDIQGQVLLNTSGFKLKKGASSISREHPNNLDFPDPSNKTTTLNFTQPTADRTVNVPDTSGTLATFTTAPTGAIADGTAGQVLTTDGSGTLSFDNALGSNITTSTVDDGGLINVDAKSSTAFTPDLDLKISHLGGSDYSSSKLTTGVTISHVEAYPEREVNTDFTIPNPRSPVKESSLTVRAGNVLRLEAGRVIRCEAPFNNARFTSNHGRFVKQTPNNTGGLIANSGTFEIDARNSSFYKFVNVGTCDIEVTDIEDGMEVEFSIFMIFATLSWSCTQSGVSNVRYLTDNGGAGTSQPSWFGANVASSGQNHVFRVFRETSDMFVELVGID